MRELTQKLNEPNDSEKFATLADQINKSFNDNSGMMKQSSLQDFVNGSQKMEMFGQSDFLRSVCLSISW